MEATPRVLPLAATAALALLIAGAVPGIARAGPVNGQKFDDWAVRCTPATAARAEHCVLVQELTRKDGDKVHRLMSTVVGRFAKDVQLTVLFTVPLGVFLPAGVVVRVDGRGEAKRMVYLFCTRSGCRAAFRLDDQWIRRLKAGSKATITVQNQSHKDVTLPLSLRGFTKGLGQIATK